MEEIYGMNWLVEDDNLILLHSIIVVDYVKAVTMIPE